MAYKEGDAIWDQIAGKWKQVKGEARKAWADLSDDDLEYVNGEREKLVGKIQERYGYERAEADRRVDEWMRNQRF
jgi:uncharacterized protein YjbJ (UPF0337 family)